MSPVSVTSMAQGRLRFGPGLSAMGARQIDTAHGCMQISVSNAGCWAEHWTRGSDSPDSH